MFDHEMHGSVALTIFWIWLGIVAVGGVAYWLLRHRLNKARKPPPPPVQYAEQLRQRMRKTLSRPAAAAPDRAGANRKLPSTTK